MSRISDEEDESFKKLVAGIKILFKGTPAEDIDWANEDWSRSCPLCSWFDDECNRELFAEVIRELAKSGRYSRENLATVPDFFGGCDLRGGVATGVWCSCSSFSAFIDALGGDAE
jgi:hypothetical protein